MSFARTPCPPNSQTPIATSLTHIENPNSPSQRNRRKRLALHSQCLAISAPAADSGGFVETRPPYHAKLRCAFHSLRTLTCGQDAARESGIRRQIEISRPEAARIRSRNRLRVLRAHSQKEFARKRDKQTALFMAACDSRNALEHLQTVRRILRGTSCPSVGVNVGRFRPPELCAWPPSASIAPRHQLPTAPEAAANIQRRDRSRNFNRHEAAQKAEDTRDSSFAGRNHSRQSFCVSSPPAPELSGKHGRKRASVSSRLHTPRTQCRALYVDFRRMPQNACILFRRNNAGTKF